jgi:cell division protein FtsA
MKEKIAVGIDLGSSKTVTVIGQLSEGELYPHIIGVGMQESSGLRKGVITDIEETINSLTAAIEEAERMAGVPVESAFVSISGKHIESSNQHGLVTIPRNREEIEQADIYRAIETAQAVAMPANREIIHVIPKTFTVDGQTGIRDPLGMSGARLEVDAHVVTDLVPHIRNLRKATEQAGLRAVNFVFGPLAAAKAVLNKKQKELGVVLIDIGHSTTGLVVYEEGDIYHSTVLPIGSDHITSDIAITLRTSMDVAEKVKMEYGSASPVMLSDKDTIDLSKFDNSEEELISRRYLAEVIQARLVEILLMVRSELKKVGRDSLLPAGAVLVGGGASLPGLVELTKDQLGLPVQLGFPMELKGMVDRLDDPRYTTAIGLMLWGIDEEESGFHAPRFNFGSLWDNVSQWFK